MLGRALFEGIHEAYVDYQIDTMRSLVKALDLEKALRSSPQQQISPNGGDKMVRNILFRSLYFPS